MRILVADDDFVSRLLLQELLKAHGGPHVATNGREAIEAVRASLEVGQPYDLICLDLVMPEVDGLEALREIRAMEEDASLRPARAARVVVTTALDAPRSVMAAFWELCDAYIVKPIRRDDLMRELLRLGLPHGRAATQPIASSPTAAARTA